MHVYGLYEVVSISVSIISDKTCVLHAYSARNTDLQEDESSYDVLGQPL